jgi:hemerythrin-like domain-containing protein
MLRLREDHQVLLRRLDEFGPAIEAATDAPTDALRASIREILAFVEYEVWTHFTIEEEALFPLLHNLFPAENAPVAGGPVFVLSEEHGILRKLVARLEKAVAGWEAGEDGAAEALRIAGRQAIRAFHKHVYKEDNIVFRLAETTMTDEQRAALEAVAARILEH